MNRTATSAASSRPAPPTRWNFLADWFVLLKEAGVSHSLAQRTTDEDIRIGGDGASEATWLQVPLRRAYLSEQFDYNTDSDNDDDDMQYIIWGLSDRVKQRVGALREAVILSSIVGKIDYDGWLTMMQANASLEVKPSTPHIPVQYEFAFTSNHNSLFMEWSTTMGHLLGHLGHGARYTRDLARIQQDVASRGGISWANLEPTPIRLSVSIAGMLHTYQETSSRLRRIVDAIHHTQSMEQEALDQQKSRGHLFRIVDISAHLRDTTLHDELVEAMTNLLLTGVRVSDLYLPETREHLPSVRLWGPFARVLTGIDTNAEGRVASVRHIKMPGSYVTQLHFALFCSALVYAKGVESLTIFCEGVQKLILANTNNGKKNLFGTKSYIRRHSWRWLSFALFSKASTSSVSKLAIRCEGPAAVDMPAIQKMVESENPFHVLRDSVVTDNLFPVMKPDFSRSIITIRPGSFFRVMDGLHDMEECQAPIVLTGELLSEVPVTGKHVGKRVALVPGYGLCWGLLPSLTKPEPANPLEQRTSCLANLAIEPPAKSLVQPKDIFDVVKLVGSRLRGLMVRADADEATFQGILDACPNLESFRFRSWRLASLDALTQAYAKGTKISSLFISVTDMPERELHKFLRQLAVAEPTVNTAAFSLERLRMEIQEDRSTGVDTLQLIETVLETNTTIIHLTGEHVLDSPVKLDRFDGQLLPGKSPTQKAQALALASGLGGLAEANPSLEVDANARKLIWELASEPRYREVRWRRTYMVRTIMSR